MSKLDDANKYPDHVKFLSDELKRNWEYYLRLLEERKVIFEYFFRIIAIPAAIIGVLTVYSRQIGESDTVSFELLKQVLRFGIFTILIAATSAFIFYCIESRNAIYYANSTLRLRDEIKKLINMENINIPCAYTRVREEMQIKIFGASFWRGMIMASINSAIAAGLINSFFLPVQDEQLIYAFLFSMTLLSILYLSIVYWNQKKSSWY